MPREAPKYAVSIGWDDIAAFTKDLAEEEGLYVSINIVPDERCTEGAYVEITYSERCFGGAFGECCRVRGAFPIRKSAGHCGAIMHMLWTGLAQYQNTPWLWTERKRRKAVEIEGRSAE